MILRIAVFALMALGLGGFGTIAWLATRTPQAAPVAAISPLAATPLPGPPKVTKILTAARQLRAGTLLKPDDFVEADPAAAPAQALLDTPAIRGGLAGAMLRRSLAPGDAVTPTDIVRPGDHGFLAAVLGTGMRGVTVGVDVVSGSAGLIWPGDHVDLVLTQELDNQALPMGRRVLGETVLPNLRVVAIDQQMEQGSNPNAGATATAKTVTLEVTPKQVEVVAVASRIGRLSVVVRAVDQPGGPDAVTAEADQPVQPTTPAPPTWASDVSPALGIGTLQSGSTMRVFQGAADSKEFKF